MSEPEHPRPAGDAPTPGSVPGAGAEGGGAQGSGPPGGGPSNGHGWAIAGGIALVLVLGVVVALLVSNNQSKSHPSITNSLTINQSSKTTSVKPTQTVTATAPAQTVTVKPPSPTTNTPASTTTSPATTTTSK